MNHRTVSPTSIPIISSFLVASIFLWMGIFFAFCNPIAAKSTITLEDKTKAAFVYHFTKFITWPASDSSETFTIGVLGDSKITEPLEEISKLKKKVGTRQIVVAHLDSVQQCGPCHLLFIPNSEQRSFSEVINYLQGSTTLTISNTAGFAEKGSCINFITYKGKIRFEINRTALTRMHLKASSQLLKLAILVNEEHTDD